MDSETRMSCPNIGHCILEIVWLHDAKWLIPPFARLFSWVFQGLGELESIGTAPATMFVVDNNINKASVSVLAMAALVIAAIAAKIHATVDAQAPVGYEDEAGFHFGNPDLGE